MLTIIFYATVIWVTFKLVILGVKAAWGLVKILLTIVLFPLVVIAMFLTGLVYIAVVVLILAGLVSLFSNTDFA